VTTLAFVVIGVIGSVVGVVVIQLAVAEQARMTREVPADLAELEAAREAEAQQVSVVTDLPAAHGVVMAGEVLHDTHDSEWEPISPDLIA
jgi:ABC-type proline/glycine betaine transport system permease subunit